MKLLSHGPEPCASANSAIPANIKLLWVLQDNEADLQVHRRGVT